MKEEKLLHLLRKKKGFFEAILELSESQSTISLEEWISILEQKKVLLACIEEIDIQLQPYRSSLKNLSQEISEELEKIRKLIQKILHLDREHLEKRKKDLKLHEEKL